MGEVIVFYSLAFLVGMCSLMVVTLKNPVTAAVFLVLDLFLLAGIYALQGAEFVAAIQVLVYAGAIVVLFMFVIMLLNLDSDSLEDKKRRSPVEWLVLLLVVGGLLGLLGAAGLSTSLSEQVAATGGRASWPLDDDNTYSLGMHLFTAYIWPFELASILILLAMVASIVIAKKKRRVDPRRGLARTSEGGPFGTR